MGGMLGEVAERKLYDAAAKGDVMSFRELLDQDSLLLDRVSYACSKKSPLHIATIQGRLDIFQEILRRNPQLAEELDSQQSSALHIASARGYVEVVDALSAAAPDMCMLRDCQGRNPLHLAAMKGHVEVLERLVRLAPVAATEKLDRGQTVLHLCVKHNQLSCLKVLARRLSELVCALDEDGETVLHLAVRFGQVETIQYLVGSTNIDKSAKNSKGQTPLEILKPSPSENTSSDNIRNILLHASSNNNNSSTQSQPVEWPATRRDSIMVVAILIATMAFQAGVSPAGGVWQDDSPSSAAHGAGEAVMAYKHPDVYKSFIRSNAVAFVSSLSTILLLISGLPFKHRLFMWWLMAIMWSSVTSIAITFAASIVAVTPRVGRESFGDVIVTEISVWFGVMGILLVGNTLRLLNRWRKSRGVVLWRRPGRFGTSGGGKYENNGDNRGV